VSETPTGIYRKFEVRRTDGSSAPGNKHKNCAYFVLDLQHDKFAPAALHAYAAACRVEYPELAAELETAVRASDLGCGNEHGEGLNANEYVRKLMARSEEKATEP